MANRFFRARQIVYPGNITQVPPATQTTTYQALNDLSSSMVSAENLPLSITDPIDGQILVFNGTDWTNEDHLSLPFGVGNSPPAGSSAFYIDGNVQIVGTAEIDTRLNVFGVADITGLATLAQVLNTGSAAISGGVSIAGATNLLNQVICSSTLAVSGGFSVLRTANLLRDCTISRSVTVNQGATITNSGSKNLVLVTQSTTDLDDVPQLALQAGYNIPEDRSINIEQIRNGGSAITKNYLLTGGALGTGSTAASPLLTSSFGNAFGVEGTDTSLSLISAPVGSNQPITRGLQMDVSGNVTLGSQLTVTSSAALLSTASVTGVVTVTAKSSGRCLTLNSDLGATIFMVPVSGTQRAYIRWPSYQVLSDSGFNGTDDLIFQNAITGRIPFQLGQDDTVTLGTTATSVIVSGAMTAVKSMTLQSTLAHQGSKLGFYNTSPAARPAVSGSLNANPALRSFVQGLSSLGLVTDNTGTTDPTATSFAWVNQGTATVSGANGQIYLSAPAASGDHLRLQVVPIPSGTYTVTLGLLPRMVYADGLGCGLCLYNSSSGSVVTYGVLSLSSFDSTGHCLAALKYGSVSSFTATYPLVDGTTNTKAPPWQAGACMWLRLKDDGVSRQFFVSNDGVTFTLLQSVAHNDFIQPDKIGFFANGFDHFFGCGVTVVSWQVS